MGWPISSRWLVLGALAAITIGLVAQAAGMPAAARIPWAGTTVTALLPLTVSIVSALRQKHIGVDAIALLATMGALLLGQYPAGAVIAVMFSGGRALEELAESRTRRELSALLARAPRTVQRHEESALKTVPIEEVRPGDRLLVGPGEVIPVDGVLEGVGVLDEAALTGEARPIRRSPGETACSGATNASSRPLVLCATAAAQERPMQASSV